MAKDKFKSEQDSLDRWAAVDRYFSQQLSLSDPALEAAISANKSAELPAIDVAPNQGKLLQILAQLAGARRILEIGTLGGYSTIWLARGLPPDGRLITLEHSAKHAEIARGNIERAGLAHLVEIRVAAALDSLAKLQAEGEKSFDLIFIDADKPNNSQYVSWAIKLSHPGTLIVVDNVVRDGAVIDASSTDQDVQGARQLFLALANEPHLSSTAIQTVGAKGYDGFAFAIVKPH